MRALGIVAMVLGACSGAMQTALADPVIVSASYAQPTNVYPHGALGDDIEYLALELKLDDGSTVVHQLPQDPKSRVFEDLAPRLADIDSDGAPEVIAVESDFRLGAQLAVYDETGKIASTPHIGRRFRWLAPVGVADLDGDGITEVAFVDRPHLAKSLTIYQWINGKLVYHTKFDGLTNHRNGAMEILGGIRDCGDGPQIVTANGNWSRVVLSTLKDGRISAVTAGAYTGPESIAKVLSCG